MHRLAHGPLPHRKVTPDCSLSTEVYKNGLVDSITRIAGDCRANSLSGVFPLRLCASAPLRSSLPGSNAKQRSPGSNKTYLDTRPGPIVANILICLIHQTNYLLDQQIRRLEQDFLREGGLRERMTHARMIARQRHAG